MIKRISLLILVSVLFFGLSTEAVGRYAAQFSPDGCCVLAGDYDGKVIIWDTNTGDTLLEWAAHPGAVLAVAYSPSGRFIASSGSDRMIRIWDTKTGEALLTLTGHTANIKGLSFSPDARFLLSWGSDETVRVWDLSDLVETE